MRPADIRQELPPLLRLAAPLIAAELGWMSMSIVDTSMVGRLPHSAVPMAAAALAQVIFNTLISQAFGAKEIPSANRWLLHGLVLALALGLLLIVILAFGPAILNRMPVDRAILAQAVPALYGLTWHFGSHIINIPSYQVVGSAWATSFARLYLMVVLLVAIIQADRHHKYGLLKASRRIELQHLRQLFRLGAPAGAQIFVEIAVFATVTAIIATLGPLPLAGHEVALQCASTTFMVPYAISSATAVRVGHAIGRIRTGHAQPQAASAAGWSGIFAGAAFMLFAAAVFLTLPATLARVFTPDRAVIAAAVPLLLVAAGFQFFDGIQITVTGALRGAGRTVPPLVAHLTCYWIAGLPLGILLCFHARLGAAGLWLGLLIALTGAALVLLTVWRRTTSHLVSVD